MIFRFTTPRGFTDIEADHLETALVGLRQSRPELFKKRDLFTVSIVEGSLDVWV